MLKEKGMDIYYSENQSMGEGTAGGGRIRADITSFLFARFGRRKTGNNQKHNKRVVTGKCGNYCADICSITFITGQCFP